MPNDRVVVGESIERDKAQPTAWEILRLPEAGSNSIVMWSVEETSPLSRQAHALGTIASSTKKNVLLFEFLMGPSAKFIINIFLRYKLPYERDYDAQQITNASSQVGQRYLMIQWFLKEYSMEDVERKERKS